MQREKKQKLVNQKQYTYYILPTIYTLCMKENTQVFKKYTILIESCNIYIYIDFLFQNKSGTYEIIFLYLHNGYIFIL